jgi:hypothetical protein
LRVVRKAATLPQLKKVPVSLRMDGSSLSETIAPFGSGVAVVGRKVTAVVSVLCTRVGDVSCLHPVMIPSELFVDSHLDCKDPRCC